MRHKLLFSFFIFLIVALPIRRKDFVLTSGQTVVTVSYTHLRCSDIQRNLVYMLYLELYDAKSVSYTHLG